MNLPPPLHCPPRAPRVHLEGVTPAVLRFQDGRRLASKLQVVSFTGGLLSLPHALAQGSQVKLMFLVEGGSVLGGAEMLSPISSTLQPFRFLSLARDDRRRLGAIIHASRAQQASCSHKDKDAEQLWIEKLRAASPLHPEAPRGRLVKRAMGAVGFITLALAGAMYLFQFHLPK